MRSQAGIVGWSAQNRALSRIVVGRSFCESVFWSSLMSCLPLKLLVVTLAMFPALALAAEKPAKKGENKGAGPLAAVKKKLSELDLSDEEKAKVNAATEEYKKKFADAEAKAPQLTQEQKQAQKEALAKAKAN